MADKDRVYTDGQIAEVLARRAKGATWQQIADAINGQYGMDCTDDAVRLLHKRNEYRAEVSETIGSIKTLKEIARVKRASSQVAKENKTILQHQIGMDDFLEEMRQAVAALPKSSLPPRAPLRAKDAAKVDMTVEALLSDIHVGKKTATFDKNVCRKRLRLFTSVLLQEIATKQEHYNVERVILALLGDNIENATMHGIESAIGCEFGNPEQVRWCIELLLQEVLIPVAAMGIPVEVVGIPGNHCRDGEKKTYQYRGVNSWSWTVYQSLKLFAQYLELTNVSFVLSEGVYAALDIYGDTILYEHGDDISGMTKKDMVGHISKRSSQIGRLIKGMRIGHWHEYSCYDNGRIIVNGSVPGQDSYADTKGYSSIPLQAITYYVRTKNRDSSYYYTLPVQLGGAA